jgi:hypothetical protein
MPSDRKDDKVERVKAHLPLPEDPPVPSDWQSFDARTVNVGTGRLPTGDGRDAEATILREPPTAGPDEEEEMLHQIGREAKDHLPGPPLDAAYRRLKKGRRNSKEGKTEEGKTA